MMTETLPDWKIRAAEKTGREYYARVKDMTRREIAFIAERYDSPDERAAFAAGYLDERAKAGAR